MQEGQSNIGIMTTTIKPIGHRIALFKSPDNEDSGGKPEKVMLGPYDVTALFEEMKQDGPGDIVRGVVASISETCDCPGNHNYRVGQVVYYPENAAVPIGDYLVVNLNYIVATEEEAS